MKTLLVFVVSLGVTYAGVGVLSPREEAEALQVFQNLCAGYGSDGKSLGGTLVYCKKQPGEIRQHTNHKVHVKGNSVPEQAVFVQPAPVVYRHNVQIESPGTAGQRTKIYMLPQQATHQLTSEFKQGPAAPAKPVVYFLNGDASSRSLPPPPPSSYETPEYKSPPPTYAPPPKPPTPPSSYGPTTTEESQGYRYGPLVRKLPLDYGSPARLPRRSNDRSRVSTSTNKFVSSNRASRIRFED